LIILTSNTIYVCEPVCCVSSTVLCSLVNSRVIVAEDEQIVPLDLTSKDPVKSKWDDEDVDENDVKESWEDDDEPAPV